MLPWSVVSLRWCIGKDSGNLFIQWRLWTAHKGHRSFSTWSFHSSGKVLSLRGWRSSLQWALGYRPEVKSESRQHILLWWCLFHSGVWTLGSTLVSFTLKVKAGASTWFEPEGSKQSLILGSRPDLNGPNTVAPPGPPYPPFCVPQILMYSFVQSV